MRARQSLTTASQVTSPVRVARAISVAVSVFRRDMGATRDMTPGEAITSASAQFLPARAADVPAMRPNTAPEVSPDPPG